MDDDLWDYCYECGGYGDDYYTDENGNMICNCETCWVRLMQDEDDDE